MREAALPFRYPVAVYDFSTIFAERKARNSKPISTIEKRKPAERRHRRYSTPCGGRRAPQPPPPSLMASPDLCHGHQR
jgi:hypothetical protein